MRSRAGSVAVYVALIKRRAPIKLIFGRTAFLPGLCVFCPHLNTFGASQPQSHTVTDRYVECSPG